MNSEADRRFRSALLGSAEIDSPPHETADAWTRFQGSVRLVAAGIEPTSGVHRLDLPGTKSAMGATVATTTDGAGTKALTWLLVGALGGGAATAGVLVAARTLFPETAPRAAHAASALDMAPSTTPTVETPPPKPRFSESPTPVVENRPMLSPLQARSMASVAARITKPEPAKPEPPPSTLVAEVERVDRARAAISPREAVRIVETYHRDFPEGSLTPDAEVVAIEALARMNARGELERRAAAFLEHYPRDPHASRIRHLLGR